MKYYNNEQMMWVTEFVLNNEGCVQMDFAKNYNTINGHQSMRYGYAAIKRAAQAGLIKRIKAEKGNGMKLYITDFGRSELKRNRVL